MSSDEKEPRFIVAEVSQNWIDEEPVNTTALLSQKLERVINWNYQRGYDLRSFSISQVMTGSRSMTETAIAVFEKRAGEEAGSDG